MNRANFGSEFRYTPVTEPEKEKIIRTVADGLTDDVIDRAFDAIQKPSEAQRVPTPKEQVQEELRGYTYRGDQPRVQETDDYLGDALRAQEKRDIEAMRTNIANMLDTNEQTLRQQGATEMTEAEKNKFFSIKETIIPPGFEIPTAEKIRATTAGDNKTPYELNPAGVSQQTIAANRANTKRTTLSPEEFGAAYAESKAALNAQKTQTPPSLFGRIASGIRSFFGRKEEPVLPTGATLSTTNYKPELSTPKPSDTAIPPTRREETDSGEYKKAA